MTPGDSPAGARRRVRLAIRKHREATGRTQGQVADELSWSISKVNRIENGDVTISKTDLAALLQLLDVRDADEVARLLEDARISRVRGWWDRPEYRDHLTLATRQLLQLESEASAIRSFQFAAIPGLLQTREYAAAMIGGLREGELSADARAARLEVRMLRQENLRSRSDRPDLIVILDEFLLQRKIGGAVVLMGQLRAMADAAREPHVSVRLLPGDESKCLLLGGFVVYDIKNEQNAFLYREELYTDSIDQNLEMVSTYRSRFEQMWNRCLTEEATLSAIEAQWASLRAALDRSGEMGISNVRSDGAAG
jgi:transcriptional regulator with XRE-family HTH domain